jgi:hypothetical protein
MNDTLNRRLQALMAPGAGTILPGAGNALGACFIAAAGFEAVFVSGAAVANRHLGKPDVGLTSITELVDHVSAIRDAVDLPIIVDADTGFGNAVNVGRTVRLLERAGASAVMLEDQTFPKGCGHFDGKDVIPAAEMVQKLRAAVDARHDAQLMILAHTDARAVEGLAGALDRARRNQGRAPTSCSWRRRAVSRSRRPSHARRSSAAACRTEARSPPYLESAFSIENCRFICALGPVSSAASVAALRAASMRSRCSGETSPVM